MTNNQRFHGGGGGGYVTWFSMPRQSYMVLERDDDFVRGRPTTMAGVEHLGLV